MESNEPSPEKQELRILPPGLSLEGQGWRILAPSFKDGEEVPIEDLVPKGLRLPPHRIGEWVQIECEGKSIIAQIGRIDIHDEDASVWYSYKLFTLHGGKYFADENHVCKIGSDRTEQEKEELQSTYDSLHYLVKKLDPIVHADLIATLLDAIESCD